MVGAVEEDLQASANRDDLPAKEKNGNKWGGMATADGKSGCP